VALEPGIRTFMTGLDSDGDGFEIGKSYDNLFALRLRTNKQQRIATEKLTRRKRAGLRRVRQRVFQQISNMVTDCHYKIINSLL
jgi:hypothetical protein